MSLRGTVWLVALARCLAPAQTVSDLEPGDIRFKWIHGSVVAAHNRDPRIQAVMYNEDTYILRENIAIHYDAPFTYLIFGPKGALLIDTGATREAEYYPLRATVDALMEHWSSVHGIRDLPLTVAMTSREYRSENQGYAQFEGRKNTTLFGGKAGEIDLGGHMVNAIPTPGAHKDGVTFYDTHSGLLFTGDLLFPGRIMIANDGDYLASLKRLKAFVGEHPLKWILGSQIDMNFLPGVEYMRLIRYKPDEHLLQLEPPVLDEALAAASELLGKEGVSIHADFTMRNRVGPDYRVERPANLPAVPTFRVLR